MIELLRLILHIMASFFKPRTKLAAEILILRQQLNVLRRQVSAFPWDRSPRYFPYVLIRCHLLLDADQLRFARNPDRSATHVPLACTLIAELG